MIAPGQPSITGYRELAVYLRARIAAGVYPPGYRLPSELTLTQTFGINRETVRRAVRELRAEGLVEVTRGRGVIVREPPSVEEIVAVPGSTVSARNPTPDERVMYEVPEGVPVLVVKEPDDLVYVYPADRFRLRLADTG